MLAAATGCGKPAVRSVADLQVDMGSAKSRFAGLLPSSMVVTQAEIVTFKQGSGILLRAGNTQSVDKSTVSLFLWPDSQGKWPSGIMRYVPGGGTEGKWMDFIVFCDATVEWRNRINKEFSTKPY